MPKELLFRDSFSAAKTRAIDKISDEKWRVKKNYGAWTTYGSSPSNYEAHFWLISTEPFKDFLARRRAQKGKFFALDVMGTANFSHLGNVDGHRAMTLVDFRDGDQKEADRKINRDVIAGDLLRNRPWLDAKSLIDKYDNTASPGYDLITCRPVAGWDVIRGTRYSTNPHNDLLEWIIVQRMFNLLSPNGGTLLVQMDREGDYTTWIETLKQTEGIHAEGEGNNVKIVKDSKDIVFLPEIVDVKRPKT